MKMKLSLASAVANNTTLKKRRPFKQAQPLKLHQIGAAHDLIPFRPTAVRLSHCSALISSRQ